jgi:hypothetical protein
LNGLLAGSGRAQCGHEQRAELAGLGGLVMTEGPACRQERHLDLHDPGHGVFDAHGRRELAVGPRPVQGWPPQLLGRARRVLPAVAYQRPFFGRMEASMVAVANPGVGRPEA